METRTGSGRLETHTERLDRFQGWLACELASAASILKNDRLVSSMQIEVRERYLTLTEVSMAFDRMRLGYDPALTPPPPPDVNQGHL